MIINHSVEPYLPLMEAKALPWDHDEWLQVDVDLNASALNAESAQGRIRSSPTSVTVVQRSRLHVWLIRLSTSILLWTCLIQLMALAQLWHPFPRPSCYGIVSENDDINTISSSNDNKLLNNPSLLISTQSSSDDHKLYAMAPTTKAPVSTIMPQVHNPLPVARKYKSNGYLLLSCNGGLNQMRAAICDMVTVARYLNLTLIVPELDKASFWADPSNFGDIFDVNHFINSLRNEVRILKKLPFKFRENFVADDIMSIPPVSWSNESYYMNQILPLIKKQKIIRFSKTDTRLANNGLPLEMQILRCKVNFEALKFTNHIEELGKKVVKYLQAKGTFLVLHLRYEMDMLAFSGCTHGCTEAEADSLTKLRYAYPWWKEKVINSEQKRLDGLCPLTPEEAVLFLQALGFKGDTQIYIAAGEIYGSKRRMGSLYSAYPNTVRKEMILSAEDLKSFQNHSSQMAALDYLVSIASDFFLPTYDGNMAKVVEGHRRFLGFKKTILPNRKKLVELVDNYANGFLKWDDFSRAVMENHSLDMGAPRRRYTIPDRPKEEEYFYANPEECITT